MQLAPEQLIYDVHCCVTGELLCSLDATDLHQAAERVMEVLAIETAVQPKANIRLSAHDAGTGIEEMLYFPHAYFVLQKLRRDKMSQH